MTDRKFAYVVLAHTDPDGLLRLVRRIRALSAQAQVFVRHQPGLVTQGEIAAAGGVDFVSDLPVGWGDWSQVEMVLEALYQARLRCPADQYVVISGQDYPIRALAAWEEEIFAHGCSALLDPMTPQPRNVELHWSVIREPGGPGDGLARRAVRAAGYRVGRMARGRFELYPVTREGSTRWWFGRPRRTFPPFPPVKAAVWMTLSAIAVDEVLRRHAADAAARDFFGSVRAPDEFYFASIIADSTLHVAYGPTTAKWFDRGAPSPRWIGLAELDQIESSAAAFCRKIPPGVRAEVIARADALSSR